VGKVLAVDVYKNFKLKKGQTINIDGIETSEIEVLKGVNLAINSGEFIVLVGPSGCGKSVFLDIVAGLTLATVGQVSIDEDVINEPSEKTAYVFQQYALLPWRTALSNIEFGLQMKDVPRKERKDLSKKLLAKFGLSGFEDRFPGQLSGGMNQRVAIARALAMEPDVLLMDEPFAALDAQTRDILQSELLRIWDGSKTTVIFVTHSIDEAVYLADRVVIMSARPSTVKEIIDIDLPRPRDVHVRGDPEFGMLRERIWDLLKEEVNKAQKDWELAASFVR
jgi:NitT/TauT family transport system ATP-binding protein